MKESCIEISMRPICSCFVLPFIFILHSFLAHVEGEQEGRLCRKFAKLTKDVVIVVQGEPGPSKVILLPIYNELGC